MSRYCYFDYDRDYDDPDVAEDSYMDIDMDDRDAEACYDFWGDDEDDDDREWAEYVGTRFDDDE